MCSARDKGNEHLPPTSVCQALCITIIPFNYSLIIMRGRYRYPHLTSEEKAQGDQLTGLRLSPSLYQKQESNRFGFKNLGFLCYTKIN